MVTTRGVLAGSRPPIVASLDFGKASLLPAPSLGADGWTLAVPVRRENTPLCWLIAQITIANSLIAKNLESNSFQPATNDDCYSFGTTRTLAYDLIFTTMNCYVTGPQGGTIVGQDPHLGPLQNTAGR